MPDPRVTHIVDQFQAETMEIARNCMEEALHENGLCVMKDFDESARSLLDSAIMCGANGAMIAMFNSGRLLDAGEDIILARAVRKLVLAVAPDHAPALTSDEVQALEKAMDR